MVDADNPENYVEIEIHHSQWWKATTFYQVGTNSIANAGLRWGYYAEGESEPCGELMGFESLMGAFTGWESYDGTNFITERGATRAITLRYDNAEKAFYCDVPANNNMSVNTQMILDLDDPRQVGVGNEWAGFASDRIKVEISTSNYASSKASYIITEFNGVNYGAEYVEDTTPPALKTRADSDASLLTAAVGREYPLFAATADDCVDGEIPDIKRYIALPGSSERIPIDGNTYTPTVPGVHELIYSVSDRSGNKSEKKYPLSVVMTSDPLVLNLKTEIPERVKVGETIAIPEVAVSGGVGPKDVSVCVSRLAEGNIKAENVKSFRPELSGTYAIEYKAKDYLGSEQTVTYFIDAVRSTSPICSFPVLPNMLLANKTVELPVLNSLDYSAGNVQGSKAVINLYASFEKNKKGEKIDYLYTPNLSESETKKTLYITYETYCNTLAYKATKEEKYLDTAVLLAEKFVTYQGEDGAYYSRNTHYTCVIYPAKSLFELCDVLNNTGRPFENIFASAMRACENLLRLMTDIGTEGEHTFEDGMISCEALQLALAGLLSNGEKREKYTTAAKKILRQHACLEVNFAPDARYRGCTLRHWEAHYDVLISRNMMTAPHGWTSWKTYAQYYLYELTNDPFYLTNYFDTLGACLQVCDWENEDVNWAFVIDPCVEARRFVKNGEGSGCLKEDVFGEEYLPRISQWWRANPKIVSIGYGDPRFGKIEGRARGACCDNDVFEHFKCLYETGMHAVAHETDDGWIAYNCTVNEDGISVTDKYVDKIRIFVKQAGIVCVNGKEYRLEKGAHYLSNENYWGIDREKNK